MPPDEPPFAGCQYRDTVAALAGLVILTGWYSDPALCAELRRSHPGNVSP